MATDRSAGRARAAVGGAAMLLLVACSGGSKAVPTTSTTGLATAPSATPSRAAVESIAVGAYPEGATIGPLEIGSPGARDVFAMLPVTLPAIPPPTPPADCPPPGEILIVNLHDGGTLTYGPCAIPAVLMPAIDALSNTTHPALAAIHFRFFPGTGSRDLAPGDPMFAGWVDSLPWPLPTAEAATGCAAGITVELDGTDGGDVTYGPCNRPGFIDQLLTVLSRPVADATPSFTVTISTSVVAGSGAQPFTLETDRTIAVRQGDSPTLNVHVIAARPILITFSPDAFTRQVEGGGGSLDVAGPSCGTCIGIQIVAGPLNGLTVPTGVNQQVFILTLHTDQLAVGQYEIDDMANWRAADDAMALDEPVTIGLTLDVLPASFPP